MNTLLTLLLAVQMITALAMIGLILLQHGKGADMGAAFGGGSSGSLFGATGSANFLSRTTAVLAAVFFACTLLLAYFGNARPAGTEGTSVLERVGLPAPVSSAPAAPASAAPASGAGAIPAGAPVAPAAVPAPAATPASGAAQIPAQ